LQVLIGPSIEETVAQLHRESDQKQFHIVDRINIDFILEISILPKAPNLTKFRMTGHLPVLQAAMSDAKYKAMMRIIDIAIPKLEDDEGPAKVEQPKEAPKKDQTTYAELRRASAFQFSKQQELILDEDSDDEGSDDEFEEASDGIPSHTAPTFHQKNFEFKFTVDRLQGSLFRADPNGGPDKGLVSLVAEHFELEVCIRPYDLSAEVVLKSLNVEDLIDEDPSPDFKRIITSDGLTKSSESPLFFVKYVQVKQQSPEFMTVYEAIDKHVDVRVSTIDVVVTRKTILTLLDFVITTFTNPDAPKPQVKAIEGVDGANGEEPQQVAAPVQEQKIRVKVDLDSIALILNNDGIRLATLSLDSADLGIFLMGKTMRIGGRLGNFSLIDDINEGAGEDSPFRQLVSIQGDELADFRYETFDPEAKVSYPGYNSSVFLRSGSIKVNFVEEPFRKIIDFAVKFGRMQALFNAARQAAMNQASQIQEQADKIHFDILVRTPIVVFPKVGDNEVQGDLITAYLGELYAQNTFAPLEDSEDSLIANKISAGVRKTRLTSEFHYPGDKLEELELLDKLDISFAVTHLEHVPGAKRPDIEVNICLRDICYMTANRIQ
jgi:vacuolar protein sorting-associated protein 13A/C